MSDSTTDAGRAIGDGNGPYDFGELTTSPDDLANSHLDLGSVLMPVVEGGQVTVEMTAEHEPEAVYLVTPVGRIGMHAFAAPRSGGLWREVVRELAESLRTDGAQTSIEDGHWGREVVARVPGGSHRFIGVDGPRWMLRCVASGPEEGETELAQLSRAVLAETVVRRGDDPHPPRELLPIVLPPVLAEQVIAAQHQMSEEMAQDAGVDPETGAYPARPLTEAPSGPVPDGEDAVVPGGAVDQSASATVLGGAGASDGEAFVDDDLGDPNADAGYGEPHDGRADDDGADDDGADDDGAGDPTPSRGSAMSRFRRRRRR
ncbi:DUF3710 domain-containing protein [Gordonia shandongensis]|uniref:DUF3710 domain-containing protein n=1 Tax=Gordonia shandongensis TaxID=376351 RepID=UPI0004024445|nr:DUF3710 domain-containing protein [Gordonia shandongensis]